MLRTLVVLFETKNQSLTADRLDMQQSTISYHLSKLRESLNDPLLIKVGRGVELSPYAKKIEPVLAKLLCSLERTLFDTTFNPLTAKGHVRFAISRMGGQLIIDDLIQAFNQRLPQVSLEVMDWSDNPQKLIQQDKLDFAIGFIPELLPNICHKELINMKYCAVFCPDHPLVDQEITESRLFDYPHVKLNTKQSAERWVEHLSDRVNKTRDVRFVSSSLAFVLAALKNTERIACVAYVNNDMFKQYGMVARPLDFIPPQTLNLLWHERSEVSAINQLAKEIIESICMDKLLENTDDFSMR
ncbi:LysR family transcriptional regulator [Thaumasiovibrio sp. DFM-14]|uniref:LysR family transcriptional regulator n=1 Tax=Thaumasiovibrio sp. DFM-14 TaxID=3384792 RepID=UPI0039A13DC9